MSLIAEILAEGYVEAEPPPGPFGGPDIDRNVCARTHCPRCDRRGMEFHPLCRFNETGERLSYRAVARCPRCGHEQEF